ncbi:MAG: SH3 domain-containing protein [Lachnospiraceae bacterium]|nr:SH3 domain-containing protein [Lachnospiraceae bacterium]
MKKCFLITLTAVFVMIPAVNVFGDVRTFPSVTGEMLDPLYWTKDAKDADDVLADADAIKHLNEALMKNPDCNMNDLAGEADTFDGVATNLARWKSALSDLSVFIDGKHYEETGNVISGKFALSILENLDDPEAKTDQEIRYGICVHRSDVRVYPTELIIADDPGDYDFDNNQNSGIRVGEPVTVYAASSDGKYYYCHTDVVSGWIRSEDIALCRDKDEWLKAWNFADDKVMVVTSSKLMLEQSNTSPELSGLVLTMGTVIEKVDEYEYGNMITNRSAYYNYPVWIPVRNDDGMYEKRKALVSAHNSLNDGYLPLTKKNIVSLAYEKLGDTYG